ncbi:hypothetical protein GCM10009789_62540 [Kribbella sancticallisti]|uniref:Integrase catalytic domain-containing protein n=1 Tax=Kribbella sancticallisti TaxID=460087 RepID=A0ABN2EBH4_9ACTN
MSKARLVITSLVVEGQTAAEVAARYGVHRAWVYKLKARYLVEGEAAFEPRSRRPTTSPRATPAATVELVLTLRKQLAEAGLDAGAETIGWHLEHHHAAVLSRNGLETELRKLNITQKNSRPNHPTTCGKVERFQQTLKKWLRAQPVQPASITELQALLDTFTELYNQHRPHRSLPHRATPATTYHARPKAEPSSDRTGEIHHRVRTDRVDHTGVVTLRVNGRLHHIGIGRTHARTHVLILAQDLQIRVVDAATGELLRDLILDPTKDYQPTGKPPGPTRKHPKQTNS